MSGEQALPEQSGSEKRYAVTLTIDGAYWELQVLVRAASPDAATKWLRAHLDEAQGAYNVPTDHYRITQARELT